MDHYIFNHPRCINAYALKRNPLSVDIRIGPNKYSVFNSKILSNFINYNDPLGNVCSKEFAANVLKFGSFLSIINNKRINSSTLFLSILENAKLRDVFVTITGAEDIRQAFLGILQMYPSLVKSKNTKRIFKRSVEK